MPDKCHYHPDFDAIGGPCEVCQRDFCKACKPLSQKICWACRPLYHHEHEALVGIYKSLSRQITFSLDRRRTMTAEVYRFLGLHFEGGSPPEEKPEDLEKNFIYIEVLALHCLRFPPLSTRGNPRPLTGYYHDLSLNNLLSLWDQNHRLVCTATDIRAFSGIFKRFFVILGIIAPLAASLFLLAFWPFAWIVGLLLFLWLLKRLPAGHIVPTRIAPRVATVEGRVNAGYRVTRWMIEYAPARFRKTPDPLKGWKVFLTVTDLQGGESCVLLEGTQTVFRHPDPGNRTIFDSVDRYLDFLATQNAVRFIGRELFNVLVCNLDDLRNCTHEVVAGAPVAVAPVPRSRILVVP